MDAHASPRRPAGMKRNEMREFGPTIIPLLIQRPNCRSAGGRASSSFHQIMHGEIRSLAFRIRPTSLRKNP